MSNKLIIAAAGSGKTTFLIDEALRRKESSILITTYTQANEQEIRRKFIKINKCIPKNVTIQTWFSFLLQDGVRPFQGQMGLHEFECKGLLLVNQQSTTYVAENDIKNYYFSKDQRIFSDKLSKFVIKCNERSNESVINRITKIYSDIFVDEVQDLAGYDLDILKTLIKSKINILLVGDPRQVVYLTHHENKYKKYKDGKIKEFILNECKKDICEIDESSKTKNYRCNSAICKFSNKMYPNFSEIISGNFKNTEHDGVFLIKPKEIDDYLSKYKPMQLRESIKESKINTDYKVINFGVSKGMEFERILIFPTKPFIEWLKNNNFDLKPTSRSKFYVAITRAKQSVAIVCEENINLS